MDKQVIEKIALEVANGLEEEGFSGTGMDYTNAFAPRFLSRIDAERGKSAAVWGNGDEIDNMLDDRAARVFSSRDGMHKTPLFLSPTPTITDGYVLVPIETLKLFPELRDMIAAAQGDK